MSKISKINMRKILNSQKHSHCNHETPKLFSRVSPTMCKKCFPLRISFVNEKPCKNLWIWSPLIKTSWTENFIFCKMPRTDFELSWSNTLSRNFRCSFGWFFRSSCPEVFCKKVFLEVSQNSQKSPVPECNFIEKETLAEVFSCEFCEISKNIFYYRTLLVAASSFQDRVFSSSWHYSIYSIWNLLCRLDCHACVTRERDV